MTHPLTDGFARILMGADQQAHDGAPYPDAIEAAFSATVHDGDCTKQCHTCLLCLANEYRAEAAIALPALLRHPAVREPSEAQSALWKAEDLNVFESEWAWRFGCDALAREVEEG